MAPLAKYWWPGLPAPRIDAPVFTAGTHLAVKY